MKGDPGNPHFSEDDKSPGLIEAMAHPIRGKLLFALSDYPESSATELAKRIKEPAAKVRYHLRAMTSAGLVETVREQRRRGVTERFYRASVTPVLQNKDEIPAQIWTKISIEILKVIFADASQAMSAGTLGSREDDCLARISSEVDAQGWTELVAIHLEAVANVRRALAKSRERLKATGERPLKVTSAVMFYEAAD
jgi:DNA-binding transcriptional ArsR family regulator